MAGPSTHTRINKAHLDGLKSALETSRNGMSVARLLDTILEQTLEQITRAEAPTPLPIVELLRQQRGVRPQDNLRQLVDYRNTLREDESGGMTLREELQELKRLFEESEREKRASLAEMREQLEEKLKALELAKQPGKTKQAARKHAA